LGHRASVGVSSGWSIGEQVVKHADVRALEAVSDLIENLRRRSDLVEKRLGIFYTKGRAFLHFHKDPAGLFADLREGGEWQRFPVNEPNECASLLAAVDRTLEKASPRRT
jgi:hypothetical protein